MAQLLMHLYQVPDDEADGVRGMLQEAHIDFYDTPASRWGVSNGGIWIRDDVQAQRARALLADFQSQRLQSARAEQAAAHLQGTAATLWTTLRDDPKRVAMALAGVLFALGLVLLPLYLLGR